MIIQPISHCRLCGNPHLEPIGDLGTLALTGIFPKSSVESVFEAPLKVIKCQGDREFSCGLLQLAHAFDRNILFGESYGYRSSLNEMMKNHLKKLAKEIQEIVPLEPDDVVIDIGSNDGTLINCFVSKSQNLLGIDPLVSKFNNHYHPQVQTIAGFFSSALVKPLIEAKKAKVISAIAVFYDLNDPTEFLSQVKEVLSIKGICVLEQSYLPSMLACNAYDMICHEHAAYYGLTQIKWLADQVDLKIIDCSLNEINGGSLRVVLAHKEAHFQEATSKINYLIQQEAVLKELKPYQRFFTAAFLQKDTLKQTIDRLIAQGKKVGGLGASTKGNVVLQFCQLTSHQIPWIAEINQDKWGRFCPGSKIPIVSEQEVFKNPAPVFLVLPWHLKNNIINKKREFLKNGGSLIFPFPKVEILQESPF